MAARFHARQIRLYFLHPPNTFHQAWKSPSDSSISHGIRLRVTFLPETRRQFRIAFLSPAARPSRARFARKWLHPTGSRITHQVGPRKR